MEKIKAVILAGGSGNRLWPVSRAKYPKQFLSFDGKETMLQKTINRLSDLQLSSCLTICNEEHRFFVAEQLREIDKLCPVLLEPEGKNTAPAITLAALTAEGDPLLLIMPADHQINDQDSFTESVKKAIPFAQSNKLVTFGVTPSEPNDGYGYIKTGFSDGEGFTIDQFVEKPSKEIAERYISNGKYYWNSGIFLFKTSKFLEEVRKFRPDIYEACNSSVLDLKANEEFLRINAEIFKNCPSESIDYAIMEHTEDAIMIPLNAGWNDLGSWSALWDEAEKNKDNNVLIGDTLIHESNNCYVRSDDKLVTVLGVEDLIIVSTKDAFMVAHKEHSQDIKLIVDQLKSNSRSEWEIGREVFRPWGKYDSLDTGLEHQVKRITVKPGEKLSVQMHKHRSEHWVVVSGTARVTIGEDTFTLATNESTYIPAKAIHSLENTETVDLELIEVQVGTYLGEDDIVRFSDRYGR